MILHDGVPRLRLGGLHPGQDILGKQHASTVISKVIFRVQPTTSAKVLAHFDLEVDLSVKAHAVTVCEATPRTSILPVTAAEIRAVRRSWRRSMTSWAWVASSSNLKSSSCKKVTISFCSVSGG